MLNSLLGVRTERSSTLSSAWWTPTRKGAARAHRRQDHPARLRARLAAADRESISGALEAILRPSHQSPRGRGAMREHRNPVLRNASDTPTLISWPTFPTSLSV